MRSVRVVIGLGSNQGDRLKYLRLGIERLTNGPVPVVSDPMCSSVYESSALLMAGAPKEWDQPFYNAALVGMTDRSPADLLIILKQIEAHAGRQRIGIWAPRELDLDILAYGDQVIESKELNIPHSELLHRDFALVPLAEIAPHWIWPKAGESQGKTASQLVDELDMLRSNNLKKLKLSIQADTV